MKNLLLFGLLMSAIPVLAQLPAPNAAGVSAGHDIFSFHDIDAAILFAKATGPVTGTKGRAFDRIGLEVKNVEQVCRDLEASGIKLDGAYRKATAMNLAVCVLTDPWGTYIEISEGLAAVK